MIIADSHVHTSFSGDCSSSPQIMVEQAISLGLKHLYITDHMDYDFPSNDICFTFDVKEYFYTLLNLKDRYKSKINLLIGVELGLQPHLSNELELLTSTYDFDFIIGSSHVADKLDPYDTTSYFGNTDLHSANYRYFKSIYDNVNTFENFDVYGHLDYVVRYGHNKNTKINYSEYEDILRESLKLLITKGKGIELNTSGYPYGLNQPHPNTYILRLYKELNGEIITIGSDSHIPQNIGASFDKASSILKELGFKYYCLFEQRKIKYVKL